MRQQIMWSRWFSVVCVISLLSVFACSEDNTGNSDVGTDGDTDSDTDGDTDSDTDSDTDDDGGIDGGTDGGADGGADTSEGPDTDANCNLPMWDDFLPLEDEFIAYVEGTTGKGDVFNICDFKDQNVDVVMIIGWEEAFFIKDIMKFMVAGTKSLQFDSILTGLKERGDAGLLEIIILLNSHEEGIAEEFVARFPYKQEYIHVLQMSVATGITNDHYLEICYSDPWFIRANSNDLSIGSSSINGTTPYSTWRPLCEASGDDTSHVCKH